MRAAKYTEGMLSWWRIHGIDPVDLAVRRPHENPCWHHARPLGQLPLAWARYENAHGAEIYIRPHRHRAWSLLFFDDVPLDVARLVAAHYDCLVVRTSRLGGCHLWLATGDALEEGERGAAQRRLANAMQADPRSCSGDHLGRLAGFRNVKRDGWVNLEPAGCGRRRWAGESIRLSSPGHEVDPLRTRPNTRPGDSNPPALRPTAGRTDGSESGREWGWVCAALDRGMPPEWVEDRLRERAGKRRGRDAARYAALTVRKALNRRR